MLSATCHCGRVRVEVPRRPRSVTNFSLVLTAVTLAMITTWRPMAPPATAPAGAGADAACVLLERMAVPAVLSSSVSARA